MTSDGGTALIIALGLGVLLGFLLALIASSAMCRVRPRQRRPRARNRRRGGTASKSAATGKRIDIPGAVARCKVSGQVEVTLASDGPAQVFLDLDRALVGAGVAVTISHPDKE